MPTIISKRPKRAERALEDCIRALLRRHDPTVTVLIPRQTSHERRRYTWDGHTLISSTNTYESVLHDVAHWLVATKKQRTVPEFGLGPDPYRNSDAKAIVSVDRGDLIEMATCDVQMVLVLALGLDPEAVTRETGTQLPTLEAFQKLRRRYPHAMSSSLWDTAHDALMYLRATAESKSIQKAMSELTSTVERIHASHAADWKRVRESITQLQERLQKGMHHVNEALRRQLQATPVALTLR